MPYASNPAAPRSTRWHLSPAHTYPAKSVYWFYLRRDEAFEFVPRSLAFEIPKEKDLQLALTA